MLTKRSSRIVSPLLLDSRKLQWESYYNDVVNIWIRLQAMVAAEMRLLVQDRTYYVSFLIPMDVVSESFWEKKTTECFLVCRS